MSRLTRKKWKKWLKLWLRRQKRLQFYQALSAYQERNHFKSLLKASQRKQKLYKRRMNSMYKQKMKILDKKLLNFQKRIIRFQLKYGIYDE
jgi:hypothetical protein